MSFVCPHCRCFPLEDHIWWVSSGHDGDNRKKQCNWWCAAILVVQDSVGPREAKVFGAHAPQGLCDNLINSRKLLTNQQKDGDCPVESIVTGVREKSRRGMMDGLRKFTEVDNHEAAKVDGLRHGINSVQVVKPRFTAESAEAVIREGADALTLRAEEVGVRRTFVDATHVEDERWRPLLVDAEWHAFCQAVYQGIEGTSVGNDVILLQRFAPAVVSKMLGRNPKRQELCGP